MQTEMTPEEFRSVLDWWMVSDPFPLNKEEHDRLEAWLLRVCEPFGYDDWVTAYHKHMKE
jgi:hypothetical protein